MRPTRRQPFLRGPIALAAIAAEAAFIGGCCGTTPDLIRALAKLVM